MNEHHLAPQLGFLFGTPRTLTIRAATNCKLVMLDNESLQNLLPQYPLIAKYGSTTSTLRPFTPNGSLCIMSRESVRILCPSYLHANPCCSCGNGDTVNASSTGSMVDRLPIPCSGAIIFPSIINQLV